MARAASDLTQKFIGHLKYLDKTRVKMERLAASDIIVRRDVEQVYLGLYIDAITSFEHLIEELFIGMLAGRIIPPSRQIVPRVTFGSNKVAREVVLGGRNYVDWFPYERETEKRAKAFFRNGLPFTLLSKNDKTQLGHLMYIRNAIAHQSSSSQRRFEQEVISNLPLTNQEKSPAGFLRSKIRIAPTQTRYENFIVHIVTIANKICN